MASIELKNLPMKHPFLLPPPIRLNQALDGEASGGGGGRESTTRRKFLKRTGSATAASLIAWNLSAHVANAQGENEGSSSWRMTCVWPATSESPLTKNDLFGDSNGWTYALHTNLFSDHRHLVDQDIIAKYEGDFKVEAAIFVDKNDGAGYVATAYPAISTTGEEDEFEVDVSSGDISLTPVSTMTTAPSQSALIRYEVNSVSRVGDGTSNVIVEVSLTFWCEGQIGVWGSLNKANSSKSCVAAVSWNSHPKGKIPSALAAAPTLPSP